MEILIITHSKDNDGHLSAALCQYFEEIIYRTPKEKIKIIRWSYGDKDPDLKGDYGRIYLLDLTLSPYCMNYLINIYENGDFIWIDHHRANYEPVEKANNMKGVLGTRFHGAAACIQTWLYWTKQFTKQMVDQVMYNNYAVYTEMFKKVEKLIPQEIKELGVQNVYTTIPYWLYYVSSYDTFKDQPNRNFWEKQVLPFEYFMRSVIDNPEGMYLYIKKYFEHPESSDAQEEIGMGKVVLMSTMKRYKSIISNSYELDVLNEVNKKLYKVIVINTTERGLILFDSLQNRNRYDYFILWNMYLEDGIPCFKYSAYSEKKDIFVPNLQISGIRFGGHPHAGGCVSKGKPII